GKMLTAQVLTGSRNKKVIEFGFDRLSTYGILKHYSAKDVANLMEFMISQDLLAVEHGSFPTIYVTEKSKEVLKGNQKVLRKGSIVTQQVADNDPLFEELRVVRKRLADESNVPPFVVFSDKH
ncbi:HRDC domain-containing protein, partial [Leptospira santarosai]|nr:HRDC domain-containing protein [Leptospira santarosai]